MPIPDYQTLMLPLLRLTRDGAEHPFRDVVDALAKDFQLSDEERSELLPSGTAHVFGSRVGWARSYLKQAGLLEAPKRGVFRITAEGQALLAKSPGKIDNTLLNQYESFRAFRVRGRETDDSTRNTPVEAASALTPEDAMATAYQRVRALPDVPTIAEAALPGYEAVQWYGVLAPAATPRDVVAKLHAAVTRALQEPTVRERLLSDGAEPVGNTPDEFAMVIRNDLVKWGKVIKAAGITAE